MSLKTKTVILGILLALSWCEAALGEGDRPEADLSVSILSQYIWRGQELSRDSVVLQPSATFSFRGFSANIWMNYDTDPYDNGIENLNEVDYTISYGHSFGIIDAEAGYIYYSLDGLDDSQELYISGTVNTILAPTLTIYQEFAHYNSTYIVLGVSHSIDLSSGISLDLGLQGSYLASQDAGAYPDPDDPSDKFSNLHDGILSASMPIPFSAFMQQREAAYFTVTPELHWVFPLGGDASKDMADRSVKGSGHNNFVYGGITLSMAF
jgi:hypothetical protein